MGPEIRYSVSMWRYAALLCLAAGCSLPLPDGAIQLDAAPTAAAVYGHWGMPMRGAPPVWGVPTNCMVESPQGLRYGFRDRGLCVGGFSNERDGQIVLVLLPGVRWSDVLVHELIHEVYNDSKHTRRDLWDRLNPVDSLETESEAWLRTQPELDLIRYD